MTPEKLSKRYLNALYRKYNRREYLGSDPVEQVHRFRTNRDRELAGLIASSLAYGRVRQIQRSLAEVFRRLGPPADAVTGTSPAALRRRLAGFKHRFTTGAEMAALLIGAGRLIREHGSLGACFVAQVAPGDETSLPALCRFTDALRDAARDRFDSLVPTPSRGSACKRLHLYLRWMVRDDAVDLGLWRGVPRRLLVVPLDTHMHRIGRRFGLTCRRSADLRTALEITRGFAAFSPRDPVRYDFALTRLGILGQTV